MLDFRMLGIEDNLENCRGVGFVLWSVFFYKNKSLVVCFINLLDIF